MQKQPVIDLGISAFLAGLRLPVTKLCVACSGGIDSNVLLHAVAALRTPATAQKRTRGRDQPAQSRRIQVRAIHVNHHLHDQADGAQAAAEIFARAVEVPLTVSHVDVHAGGGESIEAVARELRYGVLREALAEGEVLLTAHHRDDQLETVLLHLVRGAGMAGLAGMARCVPFGPGWHARPLLDLDRAALAAYANAHGIVWADDPTNADTRFDRNYLRQRVVPLLVTRWPAVSVNVARAASNVVEANALLDEVAAADVRAAADGFALRIPVLRALSPGRMRNAIRYWIRTNGRRPPSSIRLKEILAQVFEAGRETSPAVRWANNEARRYRDRLFIADVPGEPPLPTTWDWRRHPELDLGPGMGRLRLAPAGERGLPVEKLPCPLQVRWRHGTARLRPDAKRPSRTLKQLFQESGVVPWMRERIPLLFAGKSLVVVGDLWSDAAIQPPLPRKKGGKKTKKPAARAPRRAADRFVLQWNDRPALF